MVLILEGKIIKSRSIFSIEKEISQKHGDSMTCVNDLLDVVDEQARAPLSHNDGANKNVV